MSHDPNLPSAFRRGSDRGSVRAFRHKPANGPGSLRGSTREAQRAFKDIGIDADEFLNEIFTQVIHAETPLPFTREAMQQYSRELIEVVKKLGYFSFPFREAKLVQGFLGHYEEMLQRIEGNSLNGHRASKHKPPYSEAFVTAARDTLQKLHSQLNEIRRESRAALREHQALGPGNIGETTHKPSSQLDLSPDSSLSKSLEGLERMTHPDFRPQPGIRIAQNGSPRAVHPYPDISKSEPARNIA